MIKNLLEKRKKMNNGGFTIVELLVATAILSIVVVIVYSFMMTSSRFYERTSADADIQMEAQLVANTISDLIIDCEVNIRYDESVSNQIPDAFNSGEGSGAVEEEGGEAADPAPAADDSGIKADPDDGKTLEIDNCDYQFLIINAEDDKLYYVERTADPTTGQYSGSFDLANAELLAENVTEFSVDLSRVKGKGQENIVTFSMTYKKGNRSYAGVYQVNLRNQVTVNEVVTEVQERKTTIDKLVMSPDLYVTIKGKENPDLFVTADRNLNFNVSYKANNLTTMSNLFTWSMDSGYQYAFPDPAPTGAQATISLPDDYDLSSLPGSNFRVTVQSNIPNKAGENLTASAMVYFKKVQNVTVAPKMGVVNGKAYANSTVVFDALVDGWHLDNSEKYVTWQLLYNTDGSDNWLECPSNVAAFSQSNTIARIDIAENVTEHYRFKVIATSKFDTEWDGECIFAITIPPEPMGNDAPSRGVEIDLVAYFKSHPENFGGVDFSKVTKIENWRPADSGYFDEVSSVAPQFSVTNGRDCVYLDYEVFKYQNQQLLDYYEAREINVRANVYYPPNQCNTGPFTIKFPATSISGAVEEDTAIIIPYGGDSVVTFSLIGYNVTSKDMIGIYLGGDNVNANAYGMLDLNNYLRAEYVGSIGTRETLVDTGGVKVISKSSNPIRPIGPTDVKITINEMYTLAKSLKNDTVAERGELSYQVYVANVEGANVYVPCCNDKGFSAVTIGADGLDCSTLAPCNVAGRIYKEKAPNGVTDIYRLEYNGNTYYYNTAYHYWQKQ